MSTGVEARIEPVVGRYLHCEIGGRPHRVYFEEAGAVVSEEVGHSLFEIFESLDTGSEHAE